MLLHSQRCSSRNSSSKIAEERPGHGVVETVTQGAWLHLSLDNVPQIKWGYASASHAGCQGRMVFTSPCNPGAGVAKHTLKQDDRKDEATVTTELVLLGTAGAPLPIAGRGASRPPWLSTNESSLSTADAGRRPDSPTPGSTSPASRPCSSRTFMPTILVI
jgi:hypothetical protein